MSNSEQDILTSINAKLTAMYNEIWMHMEPYSRSEFTDYAKMELIEQIKDMIEKEKERYGA